MTREQLIAIKNPTFLAEETMRPRFQNVLRDGSTLILTVNAGYE